MIDNFYRKSKSFEKENGNISTERTKSFIIRGKFDT